MVRIRVTVKVMVRVRVRVSVRVRFRVRIRVRVRIKPKKRIFKNVATRCKVLDRNGSIRENSHFSRIPRTSYPDT